MDIVFVYADKLKVLKCMLFYAGKFKKSFDFMKAKASSTIGLIMCLRFLAYVTVLNLETF